MHSLWLQLCNSGHYDAIKMIVDEQDQKMEGLVVQLDTYARLGIPKLHHLNSFQDPSEDKVEEGRELITLP
jgi:hypothetical protein